MSTDELSLSVTAATDAFDQVVSLQELLEIALDTAGQSLEKRQARTELLLICYGCGQNQLVGGSAQPGQKYGSVLKDW